MDLWLCMEAWIMMTNDDLAYMKSMQKFC